MHIDELVARTLGACESEAVARGFPPKAGYDVFWGSYADDSEDWSAQQFADWMNKMQQEYGQDGFLLLYEECSNIMARYAEQFAKHVDPPA